jgi:hypothetical protein
MVCEHVFVLNHSIPSTHTNDFYTMEYGEVSCTTCGRKGHSYRYVGATAGPWMFESKRSCIHAECDRKIEASHFAPTLWEYLTNYPLQHCTWGASILCVRCGQTGKATSSPQVDTSRGSRTWKPIGLCSTMNWKPQALSTSTPSKTYRPFVFTHSLASHLRTYPSAVRSNKHESTNSTFMPWDSDVFKRNLANLSFRLIRRR